MNRKVVLLIAVMTVSVWYRAGYSAAPTPSRPTGAAAALEALDKHENGTAKLDAAELARAAGTVRGAMESLRPQLRELAEKHAASIVPSPRRPLGSGRVLGQILLTWQIQEAKRLPPEQVRAHPAAATFPGSVPQDVARVTRSVVIDTSAGDWHSTGLYAPPGEVVTVKLAADAVGKRLILRIGAHRHGLWRKDPWRRCPDVLRRVALDQPVTRAASAFGGLVYIDVPRGCAPGVVAVNIGGAVEAPYFVAGKTDAAKWRSEIRLRKAPWAELATRKVVLTVPSTAVRKLDDPADLMAFWDRIMDSCAELACIPTKRPRPERYVTDVQLVAGYMHAGYPVMTHLDAAPVVVDKARMMANAHGGVWGLFHEMGHNHQSRDWTFAGTGEVTVNLFTLHAFETVCGLTTKSRPHLYGRRRERTIETHLAGGAKFTQWQRDPFLALLMYMQLREAFGWEAYKKVFAEYRRLPHSQRPRSDDERRDQWMVRFSRAVGRNLGPFFQAWGVPTSQRARDSIAKLPKWMPAGFPPK